MSDKEEKLEELDEQENKTDAFKENVNKMKERLEDMKEKYEDRKEKATAEETSKGIKPLVTCRVLFISALDKIYLIILALYFVFATYNNFAGDLSSVGYGFWQRVLTELLIILIAFIMYLLFNWFYKCAVKTILCLTENEVYKEAYVPFNRWEVSIPLNKITAVSTYKFFWIFRAVVIHQYGKLPMVFWTWNNEEFKVKATELIMRDKEKVQNKYDDRNIITKDKYKYVLYAGAALVAIIALLGVARFFCYLFSTERNMVGTYAYKDEEFVLKKDGTCELNGISSSTVTGCNWYYNKENSEVTFEYDYTSYYGYTYTSSITTSYNKKEHVLSYDETRYVRK